MMPAWPSEQNPSSPPMSPMPGTEHGPPAGLVADTVLTDGAFVVDSVLAALSVRAAATLAGRTDVPAPSWRLGCAAARTRLKSTTSRTSAMAVVCGTRRALNIWGSPRVSDARQGAGAAVGLGQRLPPA